MGDDPQARLLIGCRAQRPERSSSPRSVPRDDLVRLKLPAVLPTSALNVMLDVDGRQIAGAFSGDILDALQPGDLDQLQDSIDLLDHHL
jgi:hypothetical protein